MEDQNHVRLQVWVDKSVKKALKIAAVSQEKSMQKTLEEMIKSCLEQTGEAE